MTWIGQILSDRRLCSDTTYAEKRVQAEKLAKELDGQTAPDFDTIFKTLRHVLILAIDRLDYDTLHLAWLPQLTKVAQKLGRPSIDV